MGQRLERFFRRIARQLDNEEQFTLQDLGDVLSFRPLVPEEADERVFELVTQAVRERRCLAFEYRKPGEKRAERRRGSPCIRTFAAGRLDSLCPGAVGRVCA